MLEQIYLERREEIDKIIKNTLKKIENKLTKIDANKIDREIYSILEENYNLKISGICEEIYLQGLKDGANLILEIKEK